MTEEMGTELPRPEDRLDARDGARYVEICNAAADLHAFSMRPRTYLTLMALVFWIGMGAPAVSAQPADSRATPAKTKPTVTNRKIQVEVRVPDGAWAVVIEEIWRVRGELWVFARVERPPGAIGALMICSTMDEITARLPDLPTRTFIVGKTCAWKNTEPVEWIEPNANIFQLRRDGSRMWRRPAEE
jgi:hypothetical protein